MPLLTPRLGSGTLPQLHLYARDWSEQGLHGAQSSGHNRGRGFWTLQPGVKPLL